MENLSSIDILALIIINFLALIIIIICFRSNYKTEIRLFYTAIAFYMLLCRGNRFYKIKLGLPCDYWMIGMTSFQNIVNFPIK